MSKLRLGILGAGMAAKPHGAALTALRDRVEVAGVYTPRPARREAFAAEWGFPVATSMESLLQDPTVDAMLILTPPNARIDIVGACARAGKIILCEKPLERTVDAAEQVVALCEEAGVPLGVVFHHRFRPAAADLRALLDTGALGRIHAVRVEVPWWRGQDYYDEPGRGSYERDGGGVLIAQAIHTLDLMLSFTGPVTAVQAMAATTGLHRMEAEDFVTAGLRFANGAVGALFATTAAYPGGAEAIRLDCDHGSAVLRAHGVEIAWRDGRRETLGGTPAPKDWHQRLIAHFLESLAAGRRPVPGGQEGLEVQRLLSALVRSSETGRRVTLAETSEHALGEHIT